MGFQDREYQKKLSLVQARNALVMLISVNLVVFVLLIFIGAIFYFQYNEAEAKQVFATRVMPWFSLPADLGKLATKPWTIITHMFVHVRIWDILGNMLWLWLFGYVLHDLTGNRKIIPVFLYGGFIGGVAYLLSYNLMPGLQPFLDSSSLTGASAGIMAIAAAVTTISPGYRVMPALNGGIPVWIITIVYFVIDLATIPAGNPAGHTSHLAGALTGFLFVYSYRRGVDWGGWINRLFDWFSDLFNPDKPKKGKDIRKELFYKSPGKPYKKTPNITEQRIDEILDKINQKGYQSLSEEEKELLRRASRE